MNKPPKGARNAFVKRGFVTASLGMAQQLLLCRCDGPKATKQSPLASIEQKRLCPMRYFSAKRHIDAYCRSRNMRSASAFRGLSGEISSSCSRAWSFCLILRYTCAS